MDVLETYLKVMRTGGQCTQAGTRTYVFVYITLRDSQALKCTPAPGYRIFYKNRTGRSFPAAFTPLPTVERGSRATSATMPVVQGPLVSVTAGKPFEMAMLSSGISYDQL